MKNIKNLIPIVCFLISGFVNGQKQYFSPTFSQSFGLNPIDYTSNEFLTEFSDDNSTTSYLRKSTPLSLGGGQSYGVKYGRSMNNYLVLELGLSYFNGKKNEIISESEIRYTPNAIYNVKLNYSNIFNYNAINFMPSVLISPIKNLWNPYLRMGLMLSYGKLKENQTLQIFNNLPGYYPLESYKNTYLYSSRFLVGWHGGLGIEFSKEKLLNFFIEAQYLNLSCEPDYKECIDASYRDEDNMDNLTDEQRTVYFVENNASNNDMIVTQRLKQKFSMNNLSLQCGLKFYINKK